MEGRGEQHPATQGEPSYKMIENNKVQFFESFVFGQNAGTPGSIEQILGIRTKTRRKTPRVRGGNAPILDPSWGQR